MLRTAGGAAAARMGMVEIIEQLKILLLCLVEGIFSATRSLNGTF